MSRKKKHRSANDYLLYLKGEIPNQERHAFEKGLEADPFDREAMEGLETLDSRQAEQDILNMHNRLRKRLSRRRRVAFYSVAATVASLLIVGTVFLKIHDFNPRPDENKVYEEETFDPGTSTEAESLPPARNEMGISDSGSPTTPGKGATAPQSAPLKKSEPAKGETKGETKIDKDQGVSDLQKEVLEKRETYTLTDDGEARVEPAIIPEVKPAPAIENLGEDQVTHMEAQPSEGAAENMAVPSTQKSARVRRTMSQPVVKSDAPDLDEVVVMRYSVQEEKLFSDSAISILPAEENGVKYSVPEPVGGAEKYKRYVEKNIEFPQEHRELQRAVVVLEFKVKKNGEIAEVIALKSAGEAFTREAIRLLMEGPAWNPAATDKGPREESVRMHFVFKRQ